MACITRFSLGFMELGPFCSKKSETLEAIAYGSMVFMEKSCGKASSGEKSFLLLLPNVESKAFLSENTSEGYLRVKRGRLLKHRID